MKTGTLRFDPTSPEFTANPYPCYDLLRQTTPIHYSDEWGYWLLTRHDDCSTLLWDKRLGHDAVPGNPMIFQNPPDHTRLRRLVNQAFTPHAIEGLRDRVEEIADELLEGMVGSPTVDLMAAFACPLPVTVIAELLGVPPEDRDDFAGWSAALAHSLDPAHSEGVEERSAAARSAFTAYFSKLIQQRREAPEDDLLTLLVRAEASGDLTEIELYVTCMLILTAGHITTVNLIGNGMLALLRAPEQLRLLRDQPDLIRSAVEEMLRFDSPLQVTFRYALEDVEYKGHHLARGDVIAFMLGAANRDPVRFENPNQLDIRREENPHLAFGAGIHLCLGAPLARLESEIAFTALLRRFPGVELASENLEYKDGYALRELRSLPLRV